MINALLAFIVQVIMARGLEPQEYGKLNTILTICTLLAPLAACGVPQALLKKSSEKNASKDNYLQAFVLLILICFIICFFLYVLILNIIGFKPSLLIVSLYSLIIAQVLYEVVISIFQINGQFKILSYWQPIINLTKLSMIAIVFYFELSNDWYYISLFISAINIVIFSIYILKKNNRWYKKIPIKNTLRRIYIVRYSCVGFCISSILYLIYYQSDIIILNYISGNKSVGLYSVAFTILSAAYILPSVIFNKYYLPFYHKWMINDKKKLIETHRKSTVIMFLIGAFTYICIYLSCDEFISLVYGSEYKDSASYLKLLALNIPIVYFYSSSGLILMTGNLLSIKLRGMFIAAAINIILNLILVPILSVYGAIISTIIANIIICIFYFYYSSKVINNLKVVL
ncbi:Polysaccharide biosynthesis protein [Photobacterium malacitanum]|uniref:Polysaccharide biosynthesis protein n=2 Tax=Photobacterium malacitanum TaxID=2204294 RepID=A0A1Y6MGC1_9GAMM|nr:Polysaccharide biosynthesis protein [Photobacterium malacitanum]